MADPEIPFPVAFHCQSSCLSGCASSGPERNDGIGADLCCACDPSWRLWGCCRRGVRLVVKFDVVVWWCKFGSQNGGKSRAWVTCATWLLRGEKFPELRFAPQHHNSATCFASSNTWCCRSVVKILFSLLLDVVTGFRASNRCRHQIL